VRRVRRLHRLRPELQAIARDADRRRLLDRPDAEEDLAELHLRGVLGEDPVDDVALRGLMKLTIFMGRRSGGRSGDRRYRDVG
jgi:hypothetical protein